MGRIWQQKIGAARKPRNKLRAYVLARLKLAGSGPDQFIIIRNTKLKFRIVFSNWPRPFESTQKLESVADQRAYDQIAVYPERLSADA